MSPSSPRPAPRSLDLARLTLLMLGLGACSPDGGATDAGLSLDAPSELDAGAADAGTCDVAPAPSDVPALAGQFVVLAPTSDAGPGAPDAGALDAGESADAGELDGGATADAGPSDAGPAAPVPPEPRGGDPMGTWRFERVTFFTAPETAGMFDPAASRIAGTAWAVVGATDIRFEFDFDITLETSIAGTLRRRQTTRVRGTYTVEGSSLRIVPSCSEGGGTGMGAALSFTAETGTGVLVTRVAGMLGETIVVLEGTREP